MDSKLVGGILLVTGTSIGAGMLALPLATAQLGFWGSVGMLVLCWAIMTACAFIFLEVNLWLPADTNLVSMAGATLGKTGQAIAWLFFLLLLYSIISAYIAGGGDLLHNIFAAYGLVMPLSVASVIFTCALGAVVYCGIRFVDYVNRGLMFGKLGTLVLLVVLLFPFVSMINLSDGQLRYFFTSSSITVPILSFTCAMIIPSLRNYFGDDHRSLCKAILIGMFIPLLCYIAWDMVIMGVIPINGAPGLNQMLHSQTSNSDLVNSIKDMTQSPIINIFTKFFTSICMATSFLSVSLGLSDFLSDGFGVAKKGLGNLLIFGFTFIPPLAIVLFYPDAFIRGLKYAGISIFILMVLMPPLMAWRGRYHHDLADATFQVRGGKFLLAVMAVFGILMIVYGMGDIL